MATVPISDSVPKNTYTATAGQTIFPYTFWIRDEDDITVFVNGTAQTLGTNNDYTVSATQQPAGANVVFNSGLNEDDVVVINYIPDLERLTEYTGTIRLEALNTELSYITTVLQYLERLGEDSVRSSDSETVAFNGVMPDLTGNGGKALALSADATGIQFLNVTDATLIGNYESLTTDGNNSDTVFALGFTPVSVNSILVEVDGVILEPTVDYTVSGSSITFTTAPSTGADNISVRNLASGVAATTPADGSVTTAKLQDLAVTSVKLASDAVSTSKIQDDAVTLAKLEDGTQGDILYYGASGAPARLTAGAAGQVLQSGGAGVNPSWVDAASGGLVLLGSYSASNVTSVDIGSGLDLDAPINSTYDIYELRMIDIVPSVDGVMPYLQTSADGGATFDNGANSYFTRLSVNGTNYNSLTTQIELFGAETLGNTSNEAMSATLRVYSPSNLTNTKRVDIFLGGDTNASGELEIGIGWARREATAIVDALRIFMSSGNITSGDFYLYGIKTS